MASSVVLYTLPFNRRLRRWWSSSVACAYFQRNWPIECYEENEKRSVLIPECIIRKSVCQAFLWRQQMISFFSCVSMKTVKAIGCSNLVREQTCQSTRWESVQISCDIFFQRHVPNQRRIKVWDLEHFLCNFFIRSLLVSNCKNTRRKENSIQEFKLRRLGFGAGWMEQTAPNQLFISCISPFAELINW